jgi:hypothetical protein
MPASGHAKPAAKNSSSRLPRVTPAIRHAAPASTQSTAIHSAASRISGSVHNPASAAQVRVNGSRRYLAHHHTVRPAQASTTK